MNRLESVEKRLFWFSIAVSLPVLSTCIGIAIIRSSTLSLSVANTKLVTQSRAVQAKELSLQLEQIADRLEQQEQANLDLLNRYNELKATHAQLKRLQPEIERVEKLSEATPIGEVRQQLSETTQALDAVVRE